MVEGIFACNVSAVPPNLRSNVYNAALPQCAQSIEIMITFLDRNSKSLNFFGTIYDSLPTWTHASLLFPQHLRNVSRLKNFCNKD